mmetsp:Transcript_16469/g.28231  ORF Transcript_16469/g.28231 Transcript_16469/m.28231 type:complete len:347 (-) Transcript_16469:168-1208(-)
MRHVMLRKVRIAAIAAMELLHENVRLFRGRSDESIVVPSAQFSMRGTLLVGQSCAIRTARSGWIGGAFASGGGVGGGGDDGRAGEPMSCGTGSDAACVGCAGSGSRSCIIVGCIALGIVIICVGCAGCFIRLGSGSNRRRHHFVFFLGNASRAIATTPRTTRIENVSNHGFFVVGTRCNRRSVGNQSLIIIVAVGHNNMHMITMMQRIPTTRNQQRTLPSHGRSRPRIGTGSRSRRGSLTRRAAAAAAVRMTCGKTDGGASGTGVAVREGRGDGGGGRCRGDGEGGVIVVAVIVAAALGYLVGLLFVVAGVVVGHDGDVLDDDKFVGFVRVVVVVVVIVWNELDGR